MRTSESEHSGTESRPYARSTRRFARHPRWAGRPAAARFPGASGRSRGQRPSGAHRPADQQGHRAAPAGALAVPGRRARGQAAGVPVHQCDRRQGPALRHAGGGRRARRLARNLRGRHGAGGEPISARPGCGRSPVRSRRSAVKSPPCQQVVDDRRRAEPTRRRAGAPAGAGVDARASIRRRILRRRSASPAIPIPASRTWARIGRR